MYVQLPSFRIQWTVVLALAVCAWPASILAQSEEPEPPPWLQQTIPGMTGEIDVRSALPGGSLDLQGWSPEQGGEPNPTEEYWQSELWDHRSLLFRHGNRDPNSPIRHVGKGEPLVGTSWLNRPYHVDAFVGGLMGDDLNRTGLRQRGAVFSGLRLGWDADHYWGLESRLGISDPNLSNGRRGEVQFFDLHVMYFPWGDARWRPYMGLGSGIARYSIFDDVGQPVAQTYYQLPISAGMKFMFQKWLAVRVDVSNNIAFGTAGLRSVNNVSLTSGLEWHFGGKRRSYYPFDSYIRAR